MKIAAILTCYNRKEKTFQCLASLFEIIPTCKVYLVDDNSTDGTSTLIHQKFPQVYLIQGNGNLFWSRGMYTAWKEAIKENYDYYLWLNDDIKLYPFFLKELIECQTLNNSHCIISGLIEDFNKNKILYGGSDVHKKLVQPNKYPQEIKFMNGNVKLIWNRGEKRRKSQAAVPISIWKRKSCFFFWKGPEEKKSCQIRKGRLRILSCSF